MVGVSSRSPIAVPVLVVDDEGMYAGVVSPNGIVVTANAVLISSVVVEDGVQGCGNVFVKMLESPGAGRKQELASKAHWPPGPNAPTDRNLARAGC